MSAAFGMCQLATTKPLADLPHTNRDKAGLQVWLAAIAYNL